jgi:hypothetical protein
MDNVYLQIVIWSIVIVLPFVGLAAIYDHFEAKNNLLKQTSINTRFVEQVRDSIGEALLRHPETPKSARISGRNAQAPIDFGHIYGRGVDCVYQIKTPTTTSYDTDSTETTLLRATYATLTVSGRVGDFTIELRGENDHLIYSSKTGLIVEQNPPTPK